MNVFFHAVNKTESSVSYFDELKLHCSETKIDDLPAEFGSYSGKDFNLSSGDILILFILNKNDLDLMINKMKKYEMLRIILILDRSVSHLLNKCMDLFPRYFLFNDEGVDDLVSVLSSMVLSVSVKEGVYTY